MPIRAYRGIQPRIHETAFVHPDAVVIGDVEIGPDSSVWPGVVIRGDVNIIRIGRGSNVQDGAILHVGRPTEAQPQGAALIIGDHVTIGHRVVLHGCTLEDGCLVGIGAVVMDRAVIGAGAMVAAASLIPPGKQVEEGSLWRGAPASFSRALSPQEREGILATSDNYRRLAREHAEDLAEDR